MRRNSILFNAHGSTLRIGKCRPSPTFESYHRQPSFKFEEKRAEASDWIARARCGSSFFNPAMSCGMAMQATHQGALSFASLDGDSTHSVAIHHSAVQRSVGKPPCRRLELMPYWLRT